MHLGQGDLFWGMDIEFVKTITDLGVNAPYNEGDIVFNVGDKADYFYILLKGHVIMERGKGQWYTAEHPGEVFGWSALINRDDYAAVATSGPDTELLKFERGPFLELLEQSPENKAALYESLSRKLGNQLLETYISITC